MGIQSMWQRILEVLDPTRIVIFARLKVLGLLIGCEDRELNLSGRRCNTLQIIELDRNIPIVDLPSAQDKDYGLATKAYGSARFSQSSILHLRRWSHIGLNEGNFLDMRASMIGWTDRHCSTLLKYLFPRCCAQKLTSHEHRLTYKVSALSFVDSFAYTAILPPDCHLLDRTIGGMNRWHYVRKLDMQLGPPAGAEASFQRARKAAGMVGELWMDTQQTYNELCVLLEQRLTSSDWRLRTIIVRDPAVSQDTMDEIEKDLYDFADCVRSSDGDSDRRKARHDAETLVQRWRMVDGEEGGRRFLVEKGMLGDLPS